MCLLEDALTSEKVFLNCSQFQRLVSNAQQRVNGFQALFSRVPLCRRNIDAGHVPSQQSLGLVGAHAEELSKRPNTQALCGRCQMLLGFTEHLAVDYRIEA